MEEKKKRNVNIIAILLIVAVVVNVAMSGYICFDKVNDKKVVAEYEANASDMQNKIDDLQKAINSVNKDDENALQEGSGEIVESANTDELYDEIYELQEQLFGICYPEDEDIIDTMAKILFYRGSNDIIGALVHDYTEYQRSNPVVEVTMNGFLYEKCDVLYSDVVERYSKVFTGNALDEFLSRRFADVDGYLYISRGGATGWAIVDAKVTRVSESNNEIKYTVNYTADMGYYMMFSDKVEGTCTMTIKAVDGSYRISEFDFYKDKD